MLTEISRGEWEIKLRANRKTTERETPKAISSTQIPPQDDISEVWSRFPERRSWWEEVFPTLELTVHKITSESTRFSFTLVSVYPLGSPGAHRLWFLKVSVGTDPFPLVLGFDGVVPSKAKLVR